MAEQGRWGDGHSNQVAVKAVRLMPIAKIPICSTFFSKKSTLSSDARVTSARVIVFDIMWPQPQQPNENKRHFCSTSDRS